MYYAALFLVWMTLADAQQGPCFQFKENNTYLEFRPSSFNITESAHYQLTFRTASREGVLLYAEGPDDYEALFLSNGELLYLLTNPSPSGVEGTSGGFYISNHPVNNNVWVTVELMRNWKKPVRTRGHTTKMYYHTGMTLRDSAGNVIETHVDRMYRRGIRLFPTIFIGGVRSDLKHVHGSNQASFVGDIKAISEERNGYLFSYPYINYNEKVKRCD